MYVYYDEVAVCHEKKITSLKGLSVCLSVKMSTSSRGSVGAPRETPKITTSSKLNNNIPSDPARPLGRPLTSDDDDGRWDNKWWPLKGSADNSWMFQGEFREREKGQTPDVIDRGKADDDDSWMNDDDDDSK